MDKQSWIKAWPANFLSQIARLHDLGAIAFAWLFSYCLRFNFDIPSDHLSTMWHTLPVAVLIQVIALNVCGLYRGIWKNEIV